MYNPDRLHPQQTLDLLARQDRIIKLLFDLLGPGACVNSLWEEEPGLKEAYLRATQRGDLKVSQGKRTN